LREKTPIHLDARAVQFPFERQVLPEPVERLFNIGRRLRQHRLNRLKELDAECGKSGLARDESGLRDRRERAGHHHRAAYRGRADLARLRHRIHENSFKCALAQLAGQETDDKILLGAGGLTKEIAKALVARRGRACPFDRCDLGEYVVDVQELQPGRVECGSLPGGP
jgi:hypothetical protein